jgi:hypothetical protein
MSSHQHTKTLSTDSRAKNRIRYASTKDRAKKASADVYRSYKRRVGVAQTTAASREERVHHPGGGPKSPMEKRKKSFIGQGGETKATIVIEGKEKEGAADLIDRGEEVDEELLPQDVESCFASELDLAQDRNASELFGKMYREIWPLTRSLAEMLHHGDDIVAILLCYLLSPESDPGAPTDRNDIAHMLQKESGNSPATAPKRILYVVNLVTTDVLHLIGVLARDFRHEIHGFVHPAIVPRIVYDLLNPPPPPPSETDKRQQIPMDVTIVEAAFRSLSYVFRYDSYLLIKGEKVGDGSSSGGNNMEPMRQYYGATLAHRRDYVRRLAAETYAPLIRRMKSDSARSKHIRRVIRALAASAAAGSGGSGDDAVRTVQRARLDAIDGVSLLLSQTSCGVPGRFHSKAQSIISSILGCLIPETESGNIDGKGAKKKKKARWSIGKGPAKLYSAEEAKKREVVFAVASSYMTMLRGHVREGQNFVLIWSELRQALDLSISAFVQILAGEDKMPGEVENNCLDGIHYILELINQCVNHRSGGLLEDHDEADELSCVLEKLFEEKIYNQLDRKSQASSLSLLCSLWKAKPNHTLFATKFGRFFHSLVKVTCTRGNDGDASVDPALVFAKNLLPFLPWGVAKRSLVPPLLSAAAQRSSDDSSLILLHAVATANLSPLSADEDQMIVDDEAEAEDEDALFWLHHGNDCSISATKLDALADTCLGDPSTMLKNQDGVARVAFASRCLPFLSNLGASDEGNTDETFDQSRATAIKRSFSWSLSVLNILGGKKGKDCRRSSKDGKPRFSSQSADSEILSSGAVVAQSLVLESLSIIASSCIDNDFEKATAIKTLQKAKKYANNLMFACPRSVWSVRAAAAIVGALEKTKEMLNDTSNETFDLLSPNLKARGHFLRLHTLVILNSYPRRPYVVDHSELDHADDLDEEGDSFQPRRDSQQTLGMSAVSGPCDIMETLLKIEAMPVTLANERKLNGEINRVEVLCRTGRVPIVYAEAVSNHMLGLFHVKFAPVWPAAVRALAAVAVAQETCAWPTLAQKLDEVMQPELSSDDAEGDGCKSEDEGGDGRGDSISQIRHHQSMCFAWDKSNGTDVRLFGDGHDMDGGGKVSRHKTTDTSIIFENTWKVMESVPQLTVRKSKVIVPIFLEFLHFQYYRFHDDDPDARELSLEEHLGDDSKEKG